METWVSPQKALVHPKAANKLLDWIVNSESNFSEIAFLKKLLAKLNFRTSLHATDEFVYSWSVKALAIVKSVNPTSYSNPSLCEVELWLEVDSLVWTPERNHCRIYSPWVQEHPFHVIIISYQYTPLPLLISHLFCCTFAYLVIHSFRVNCKKESFFLRLRVFSVLGIEVQGRTERHGCSLRAQRASLR